MKKSINTYICPICKSKRTIEKLISLYNLCLMCRDCGFICISELKFFKLYNNIISFSWNIIFDNIRRIRKDNCVLYIKIKNILKFG